MFRENPEAGVLRSLSEEIVDGLAYMRGGRFSGVSRLAQLRNAYMKASKWDASSAFLRHLSNVIEAVDVLDGGRRRMSLRDARYQLEYNVHRLAVASAWPGVRAQRLLATEHQLDSFVERA